MHVGLQIPNFTWPGGPEKLAPTLAEIARTADAAGFASLWVMDHFFQIQSVGLAENDIIVNMPNVAELTPLHLFGDRIIPAVAAF